MSELLEVVVGLSEVAELALARANANNNKENQQRANLAAGELIRNGFLFIDKRKKSGN